MEKTRKKKGEKKGIGQLRLFLLTLLFVCATKILIKGEVKLRCHLIPSRFVGTKKNNIKDTHSSYLLANNVQKIPNPCTGFQGGKKKEKEK